MIRKYCKGTPLYAALIIAALYAHALAQQWDDAQDRNDTKPVRALIRHT
jgi:hypothetical protein